MPAHSTSAGGQYAEYPLDLAAWDGKGGPQITNDLASFNGREGLAGEEDLSHEAFTVERIYRPESWERPDKEGYGWFCKTARKPYDLVVSAALIQLGKRVPTAVISSDGWREDWYPAMEWCREVLGTEAGFMPYNVWCKSKYNPSDARGYGISSTRQEYEEARDVWEGREVMLPEEQSFVLATYNQITKETLGTDALTTVNALVGRPFACTLGTTLYVFRLKGVFLSDLGASCLLIAEANKRDVKSVDLTALDWKPTLQRLLDTL